MFDMKLQGQHLLPVSTIQNIIEEMQNIHELGQKYTLNHLNLLLKDMSVSDEDIRALVLLVSSRPPRHSASDVDEFLRQTLPRNCGALERRSRAPRFAN